MMKYKVHIPYLSITIDKPISIEDFFHSLHLSKKQIHLLKQNKDYTLNKRFTSSSTIMLKGDTLTIKAFDTHDHVFISNYEPLDVIFEDDFILIVNKPPFMNVYPDALDKDDALVNRVAGYYEYMGLDLPVRYIHRLDYETSGLVFFCKCSLLLPLFDEMISNKEIKRQYLAVVDHVIQDYKTHTINKPIARDRHINGKMRISSTGKESKTYYQCLSHNDKMSIVECYLDSGRKHQIRVHMASIGAPLVGDHRYNQPSELINRQALHAYKLVFVHPLSLETLTIVSLPPQDMQDVFSGIDETFIFK